MTDPTRRKDLPQLLVERVGPEPVTKEKMTSALWEKLYDVLNSLSWPYGWASAASRWSGWDRSVVCDRMQRRDFSARHLGRPPILTAEEEKTFADRLVAFARMGNCCPISVACDSLKEYCDLLGKTDAECGGTKHLRGIIARDPRLKSAYAEKTEVARITGLTKKAFNQFMDNLERVGVQDLPARQVVNIDETPLIITEGKVRERARRSPCTARRGPHPTRTPSPTYAGCNCTRVPSERHQVAQKHNSREPGGVS